MDEYRVAAEHFDLLIGDLDTGTLTIDPNTSALHESTHKRWIGPPKTAASARTITLPPFLIGLLRSYLKRHTSEYVFTTQSGT